MSTENPPPSSSSEQGVPADVQDESANVPHVPHVPHLTLRAPGNLDKKSQESPLPAPPIDWLCGTWHVTHSTLPMWKTNRNVKITYTALAPVDSSGVQATNRLDDIVNYQTLSSTKVKTIHGIDTASETPEASTASWAWDWRGKGLLKIASSHWEILGWGGKEMDDPKDQWVVTYFAKTIFTPAGIDIYCRSSSGVRPETLTAIKEALDRIDDSEFKRLALSIFEVKHDGALES